MRERIGRNNVIRHNRRGIRGVSFLTDLLREK